MRFILSRAPLTAVVVTLLALPALSAQDAKPQTVKPRVEPTLIWTASSNRAVLGVTLAASSRADTAGVRVDDVDSAGPAAKAGLKSGDVITEVNGVNLRISAVDAEDLALAGIAQRRLQRTLAKAKPGDEVDLRIRTGTAVRAIKVKTVSAAELEGARTQATFRLRTSENNDQRGAIGVSIGASGNRRDTLGLFISSVITDGPAEKAGLIEGDRIAAVNGVDVRIPKEDFEDMTATSARVNRFVRELQKVEPGGTVNLRVFGGGRYRDVAVKAVKMSELSAGGQAFFGDGGGFQVFRRSGPTPGTIEGVPSGRVMIAPPQMRIRANDHEFDIHSEELGKAMEQLRTRMQELGRDMRFEVRGGAPSRRATAI